jgi:hypothetical protein
MNVSFYARREPGGERDLLADGALGAIPVMRGAYVLASTDGTEFIYPWGRSSVFYIGKASCLLRRLRQHRTFTLKAREEPRADDPWWPRYQYGAAFGTAAAWFTVRGRQSEADLEADMFAYFYDEFGSIPVANQQWPW